MPADPAPLRIFLDAGVLIDGHFNRWGVCKAIIILVTIRDRFRAVLAEPIRAEFERNLAKKTADLGAEDAQLALAGVEKWAADLPPGTASVSDSSRDAGACPPARRGAAS